jgi:DNA polymerase (family X)
LPSIKQIAAAFGETATLLELDGANPFKVRAFTAAARTVATADVDLDAFLDQARAGQIKGIGKGLTADLEALAATGDFDLWRELRTKYDDGVRQMFKVPGLGAKKIKVLFHELGIASLGELELACKENHLVQLPGFGAKTQDKILAGIARVRKFSGQYRYPTALAAGRAVLAHLEQTGVAARLTVAGSLRRHKETVKDVDLLAASEQPEKLMDAFVGYADVAEVTGRGPTKSSVVLKSSGIAVDLRVVQPGQFAAALLHFTGSKEHNTLLRGLAKKQNRKLSEYGLFAAESPLPLADEAAIYQELGLPFIPPELREGLDEIDLAAHGELPELIETADIRGVVHAHTQYSDGALPLATLAARLRDLGFAYFGVTDHSQTASYAGGLKPDDVKRQHDEIDALNESLAPFHIFKGIESDILDDGRLDYDDALLERFDFVIASIHSRFNLSEADMTRRLIRAIENPHTTIVGHLTGRLLLSRDPYALNIGAVLEAAAAHDVAVELNANPHRLDLDWRHHRRARELGIKIPICPDAHSLDGVEDIAIGVGIARKGGLTAEDVPTTYDTGRFAQWLARRKS